MAQGYVVVFEAPPPLGRSAVTNKLLFAQVFPLSRRQQHPAGPGIEVRDRPKTQPDLDDLTSLE